MRMRRVVTALAAAGLTVLGVTTGTGAAVQASPQDRRPVLAFLDGWTRQLHRSGYRAGVYSSAGAAAEDLGKWSRVYGHRIAKPDSVWFGLWDGRANLDGTPYPLGSWWDGHDRIKQYLGGLRRRIHGIRLDSDSDWVYGAVYR
jgi:hypothetical protein